jgi:NitT/TauT family transport system permease protein
VTSTTPSPAATRATTGRVGRARGRGRKQHALLRLRGDIPMTARIGIAVFSVVALIGLWWLAADVLVNQSFVPNPSDTIRGFRDLWESGDLAADVQASGLRIVKAYSLSMAIGIVLGVSIGSFRSVEALWESPIGFLRYIPATALTPLFLVAFGIDEAPKVALIVAGTVFFNVVMIADVARNVPREMVDTAYTLGAGRWRVLRRVIMPHCWPGIIDVGRINLAAAWPLLVVAELFAGSDGLGYRVNVTKRYSEWPQMWAVLLVFALIGLFSDLFLRWLRNRVSPWARS